MASYRYKVRDKAGSATLATVEASSRSELTALLRKQGFQVVTIEEAKGFPVLLDQMVLRFRKRTSPQEVVSFTRQMALLVRSGIPLVDAIESLAEQPFSPVFKEVLRTLGQDLRQGRSFSEALAQHPAAFSVFSVNMVKSAETAGILDQVLERLASLGEEEMELRGRVSSALVYPVLLVFLSLGVVTFLMAFVLPKFISIFEESEVILPLPTRILLFISQLLQNFWFLIPPVVGGAVWAGLRYFRRPEGRVRLHRWILQAPLLGRLMTQTLLARAFRVLAALLKSGVAAVPALAVTEDLMGNEILSNAVGRIRRAVVGGAPLSEPFRAEKVFPSTVVQLVAVGERTGTLDESFLHLADYYDKEVDKSLRTFTALLEPLLLLIMGLVVGFVALSVLLPIFQLVRVFQR
ncbi:MAG: type II secretion system F family protein [Candidatus Omnitrophota bacterium]|nr:type II secretion system F family protein [Candidatus Omnitrophota bacterium]